MMLVCRIPPSATCLVTMTSLPIKLAGCKAIFGFSVLEHTVLAFKAIVFGDLRPYRLCRSNVVVLVWLST